MRTILPSLLTAPWHPPLRPVNTQTRIEAWEVEVEVPEGPDWDPANDEPDIEPEPPAALLT